MPSARVNEPDNDTLVAQRRAAAERNGRVFGAGRLRIAAGSAAESCAALDLIGAPEAAKEQPKLRRVGAMLRGLSR